MFAWLPVAAVISNKILCVHGGIGANFTNLKQLDAVKRPMLHPMQSEHAALLRDVMWADPTESDMINGIDQLFDCFVSGFHCTFYM